MPNASSSWSQPTKRPFESRWKHIFALGDRGAALHSYHRYAEVLERDLALEPGEAIGAIYRQLRASTPHREELQGEDVAAVAEVPFVGRDLELDQLNQAWIAAREERAHLVLLSGEAGIGKSRLALDASPRRSSEEHTRPRVWCVGVAPDTIAVVATVSFDRKLQQAAPGLAISPKAFASS